jgi:hypothetical protein
MSILYTLPLSPEDAVAFSLDAYGRALVSCNKAAERGEGFDPAHLHLLRKACEVDLYRAAHERCFDL